MKANPLRARSLGISVGQRIVGVYTLSAFYAGVAGGLSAQTTQFVSLDVLDFHRSADVMLVLVLGGVGYLYGGIIGALVFKVMQDWIASMTPQYWQFWIGLDPCCRCARGAGTDDAAGARPVRLAGPPAARQGRRA